MANLTQAEAIARIKEPHHRRELQRAAFKKLRHQLHTETDDVGGQSYLTGPHIPFLSWVKGLLNDENNYARFLSLYRPPIKTNELTESIFSNFERIFDASDAFDKVEFDDPELENDCAEYRKAIGDGAFWKTQGFNSFKNSIDDILVIDLPSLPIQNGDYIQASEYPEPYFFLLDILQVIDIENKTVKATDTLSGKEFYYFKCEYLIFWESKTKVCVFDDTYYRLFTWDRENNGEPKLDTEVPHNLGFTPARSFWTDPLNSSARIQKLSIITKSLSELDWYLAFDIFAKYLKLYAPFPIYAIYRASCNYKDMARNLKCVAGHLLPMDQKNPLPDTNAERCPKCRNKFGVGAGKILELPVPQDKEQHNLMEHPIQVIGAEESSLAAVDRELEALEKRIYERSVGIGSDIVSKEAINEDQVKAGFESKENVLMRVKRNFEIAHSFAIDTVCRLRYGDRYKGSTISYGTKFFSPSEEVLVGEYKDAKANGMPEYELDMRRDQISATKYRNNPDQLERIRIMKALDPFPDKDIEAVMKLGAMTDPLDVLLKAHIIRFVERFERENASILMFGRKLDFDKKIIQISDVLRGYATEYRSKIGANTPPQPPKPTPFPAPAPAA